MMGVIPRIVQDIFNYIYSMDQNLEFHIKVRQRLKGPVQMSSWRVLGSLTGNLCVCVAGVVL